MTGAPGYDKLRGGYYTPLPVADWLSSWAIRSPEDTVLEPSCGDGAFLKAAANRLLQLGAGPDAVVSQLTGIEIDLSEAGKALSQVKGIVGDAPGEPVQRGDFFEWALKNRGRRAICVLGNPPFIRYQNFPESSRPLAMGLMSELGLRPNRLTNIWVPFVAVAAAHLAPGGRMAMVLPAELLQVSYAAQLRTYLVDQFERIHIVTCNEMLFEGAEQEVVLFLGEKRSEGFSLGSKSRIDLHELENAQDLLGIMPQQIVNRKREKMVNHDNEKWLKYFLNPREIDLMRELRRSSQTATISRHGTVDVGVVTGRNEFFVLSMEDVDRARVGSFVIPLVGRSSQLRGALFTKEEWGVLAGRGGRVFLFYVNGIERNELPKEIMSYIGLGEKLGYPKGYKCSVRSPWYAVPSVWAPDCFMFRQIYDFPRLVLNKADVVSTDTIHRVRCNGSAELLVANTYTSLTAASAEIEGRSYGGGVLELEPTEAERLLVPRVLRKGLPLTEIDRLVREGRLTSALRENDKLILVRELGLSTGECEVLRRIWRKMRNRRMNRKKAQRTSQPREEEAPCTG